MTPICRMNWRHWSAQLARGLSLMALAGLSHAHGDDYLDTVKAPNGGQLRMAGPYHLELVLKKGANASQASPVAVYVTDHAGQVIPTQGAKSSITLLNGKQKSSAELSPGSGHQFTGEAKYTANSVLKAVVSVQFPGQEAQQARFTPFKPVQPKAASGHEGHAH